MTRSARITRSKTRAARLTIISNIIQYNCGLKYGSLTRSFTNKISKQYKPLRVSGYLFPTESKKPVVLFRDCLWEMV